MEAESELILEIGDCSLFQVSPPTSELLQKGTFSVYHSSSSVLAQVGSTSWPLADHLATLRYDDTTYTFQLPACPDVYLCLCLPQAIPSEVIDFLQSLLSSVTAYHQGVGQQPERSFAQGDTDFGAAPDLRNPLHNPTTADKVAETLTTGGKWLGRGIAAAASFTAAGLQKGAEAAVQRMQPVNKPLEVSETTKKHLETAKVIAGQAASVSGKVVSVALSATSRAASMIADQVSKSGIGKSLGNMHIGGASSEDMRKVGVAGLEAWEAVADGLASAARVVVGTLSHETSRVVTHKYGPSAGAAARTGMSAAQDVVETGLHMYKLRPTALAKAVVKGTAKQVVRNNGNGSGSSSSNASITSSTTHSLNNAGAAVTSTASTTPPAPSTSSVANTQIVGGGAVAGYAGTSTYDYRAHPGGMAAGPAAAPGHVVFPQQPPMQPVVQGVAVTTPVTGTPVAMPTHQAPRVQQAAQTATAPHNKYYPPVPQY